MRRFEFSEGSSNKFWQITQEGSSLHLQWGRIGTAGQSQTKALASESAARAEHDKLVLEKTKKGYAEVPTDGLPTPKAKSPEPVTEPVAVPAPASPSPPPPPPVLATADRLVWPPELRKELDDDSFFTRGDLPPGPRPALVAAIRAVCTKDELTNLDLGKAKADADGLAALAHLRATYADGKEPAKLEADVEARAASLIESDALGPLAAYWSAREGLPFVLDALAGMWSFYRSYDWGGSNEPRPTWLKRVDPATNWDSSVSGNKTGMGACVATLVARADAAARTAARAHAAKLRNEQPLTVRVALALAFRDEAWAAEDARAVLALDGTAARDAGELIYLLTDRELLTAFAKRYPTRRPLLLVHRAGFAAVPVVAKMLDDNYLRDSAAAALSVVESLESARELAGVLDKKDSARIVRAFFERRPDLGLLALAPIVAAKGKLTAYVEPVLKGLLRAHPGLAAKLGASLDAKSRAVLEAESAASAPVAEADASELPPILVSPPWSGPRTKAKAPPSLALDALPFEARIHWDPGARERALAGPESGVGDFRKQTKMPGDLTPRSGAMDAFLAKRIATGQTWGMRVLLHLGSDRYVATLLTGKTEIGDPDLGSLFARFDAKALPLALAKVGEDPEEAIRKLANVEAPAVARLMATAFSKKRFKTAALRWLSAYPEAAALGLIPRAFGPVKAERALASNALHALAPAHRKMLLDVAARYGKDALGATTALLDSPQDEIPDKIPALPAFFDPAVLARPRLASGKKALPESAVRHLGTLLQLSTLDRPLSALTDVKEACEPRSLADFAWDLFQAWLAADAPSKEGWAFTALAHLGDDECARRLTPLVRAWPGESQHARAVTGLDVLASIGTDVALMHLHGIAQKLKFKGLQEKAREKIQAVAEARGLTADELADRLVPDLGLDDAGTLVLDFGPRQFKVGFDESLKPTVVDGAGKVLTDLPKPGKSDDAAKGAEAVETWKALKKDAKAVAAGQVLRLEMVMCAQRRFGAEAFRAFFVDHPLMIHLVRRVLWGVYEGEKLAHTFRVSEDRSLADEKDEAYELPANATVGLVYRLELSEALVKAWGQVFADYNILQPFDQLARAVYRPTDAEKAGNDLSRMKDVTVKTGKILGLEARGWRKGTPQDAGWVWDMWKPLPGDLVAEMAIDGGICMGWMEGTPSEQKLGSVGLRLESEWSRSDTLTLASLSPAVFSELVRDLEGMRD